MGKGPLSRGNTMVLPDGTRCEIRLRRKLSTKPKTKGHKLRDNLKCGVWVATWWGSERWKLETDYFQGPVRMFATASPAAPSWTFWPSECVFFKNWKSVFSATSGVSWLLNSVFSFLFIFFFFLFERRKEETNVFYFTGNRTRKWKRVRVFEPGFHLALFCLDFLISKKVLFPVFLYSRLTRPHEIMYTKYSENYNTVRTLSGY